MSAPLIFGILWVLAATVTALLPMRHQYAPGLSLLILAPVLVAWISAVHGAWIAAFGLFAVLSMFRRPLVYLARQVLGLPVEPPPQ